jgi:hypothetical protein
MLATEGELDSISPLGEVSRNPRKQSERARIVGLQDVIPNDRELENLSFPFSNLFQRGVKKPERRSPI